MTDIFDFDTYSRKFKDDDFLRQTMRTIHGQPVSDEQLELVRERISKALSLDSKDYLLDLCCGNGHLAEPFLANIERYCGVDAAENLIRVANIYFADPPKVQFFCRDAVLFAEELPKEEAFTKMLWYGSCQYFEDDAVVAILQALYRKCSELKHIFIGNLPDYDSHHLVLNDEQKNDKFLENPLTVFGKWRKKSQLISLARTAGWGAEVCENDQSYHGKHYRYDLLLVRM